MTAIAVSIAVSAGLGLYQYRQSTAISEADLTTPVKTATEQAAASTATAVEASSLEEQARIKAAALAAENTELQSLLSKFSAGAPTGITIKNLKTGAMAGTNQTQVFTSASLYKLFVAHGIYKQIDSGQRSLGDKVGDRTLGECLNLMITVSDNSCAEALGSQLGWAKYNSTLKSLGFNQTKFGSPMQTSAADVATLLERLYSGTLLSRNSSSHFLDLLKAQKINNRLPQGLPSGTTIAHKTGDLDGFVHDAGIVYGPKGDYIVVMTSGPWATPSAAPSKFAELSRMLYGQFSK
jgi:beta-lactamase class A